MGFFHKAKNPKRNDSGFIITEGKHLIDWNEPNGDGCIVSDRISKEGWKVGYMYRDQPLDNEPDSGWHFMKGDESDAYMNDSSNHHVFALNTVCNYDSDIIPYLNYPIGTHLIRVKNGKFIIDDGVQPIHLEKQ